MSIDPKIALWFGVWTWLLLGIANGSGHLPTTFSKEIADQIISWAAFLGWINTGILTAANGYSYNRAGPLAGVPAAVAKPIIIVAIVVWALFAFGGTAHAQTTLRPLTGDVRKDLGLKPAATVGTSNAATATDEAMGSFGAQVRAITKEIVVKAIADVHAASDDAAKRNDTISKPCWDANLALLKALPSQWENPPTDIGIALGIQIQRDLLNSITGNDASSLKVACAPLWGDQLQIVANVGALLGIKIATGGLAF